VAWWVSITPDVVRGVGSFGFRDPPAASILEAVEHYLAHYGEVCAVDRWNKCPDDFFIYNHIFVEGGRWHTLEFVVDDTSNAVGVLRVVWVEHHPGGPFIP
jgi:hypothetical protein